MEKETFPTEQAQLTFYDELREKVQGFLNSKVHVNKKISNVLLVAPDLFYLLVQAFKDGRIDKKNKALIASGLLYFIAPIDALPEGLIGPGGFLDDVVVASYILDLLMNKIDPQILAQHWRGEEKLFVALRKISRVGETTLKFLPAQNILRKFLKKNRLPSTK